MRSSTPKLFAPLLAIAMVALTGCSNSTTQGGKDKPVTRIDQLPPRVAPKWHDDSHANDPDDTVTAVALQIHVPESLDLHDAMELAPQDDIDEQTREVWQANGMRVGFVPAEKFEEFHNRLHDVVAQGATRSRFDPTNQDDILPILRRPKVDGHSRIELTGPNDRKQTVSIAGGRMQLLGRVRKGTAGRLMLEVIPHHFHRKQSIKLRSHRELMLDGRVFDELALNVEAHANRLLVISMYRPRIPLPAPGTENEGFGKDQDNAEQSAESNDADETPNTPRSPNRHDGMTPMEKAVADDNAPPKRFTLQDPPYRSLGYLLLGGDHFGKKVQAVIVIRCPLTTTGKRP